MAILSGMVGWVSTAFSLPNATCPIHLWGEKNTPLGVITLGPRQAHWMRPWLTLVTRLRPSALPYRRIRVFQYKMSLASQVRILLLDANLGRGRFGPGAWCPRFASRFWTLTWAEESSGRAPNIFNSPALISALISSPADHVA